MTSNHPPLNQSSIHTTTHITYYNKYRYESIVKCYLVLDWMEDRLGVQLVDIQIGWPVAQGSMGRVYLGRKQKPSRAVGVKFM